MNILIICAVFIVFLVLIHGFLYYKKKCSTLLNAVFAADQLKKDLVLRDKNRSKEFDFVVAQTKGLVSNISEQLYSGGLTVQSFKQQHHAEIGFVSDWSSSFNNVHVEDRNLDALLKLNNVISLSKAFSFTTSGTYTI